MVCILPHCAEMIMSFFSKDLLAFHTPARVSHFEKKTTESPNETNDAAHGSPDGLSQLWMFQIQI